MGKPDEETFNREVKRIRRDYGGNQEWEGWARQFAYHLYWCRQERSREEDAPDLEPILTRMILLSQTNKYIWDAVNLVAQAHLTRGDSLPDPLACWIEHVLVDQHMEKQSEKHRPRPRKGRRVEVRDRIICLAIQNLVSRGIHGD